MAGPLNHQPSNGNAPMQDPITKPSHYRSANGIEVIDVVDGFNLNPNMAKATEYILRADRKGEPIKDLKKAIAYLTREVEKRENAAQGGGAYLRLGFGFPDYRAQRDFARERASETMADNARLLDQIELRDKRAVARRKRSRRK